MSNLALSKVNHWPPQLVIDLAMGVEDLEDILERYGLDREDLDQLQINPQFRTQLVEARRTVAEEGLTYRKKAAVLAEIHLDTISELLDDPLTPPATKLSAWQSLTRFGALEPKGEKDNTAMPQFNIQINF